jgi:hypothetical protein
MSKVATELDQLFPGDSEMAQRLRAVDWSKTPVGPVQIYIDAYIPVPGLKHPRSVRQRASERWEEIWHIIGPLVDSVILGVVRDKPRISQVGNRQNFALNRLRCFGIAHGLLLPTEQKVRSRNTLTNSSSQDLSKSRFDKSARWILMEPGPEIVCPEIWKKALPAF